MHHHHATKTFPQAMNIHLTFFTRLKNSTLKSNEEKKQQKYHPAPSFLIPSSPAPRKVVALSF
ncbi:hypothetical protein E2C01_072776 [Portunus trituberculatus]|uniref:Uncharacterized protein n=1 Tax=Portunus trituberculatus TaxID=210409 RepID=A0A5B7HYY4_PORTR|nr:hypothetical protein [Portunus trituberculatus]